MPLAYVESWDTACTVIRAGLITSANTAFTTRFGFGLVADKTFHLDFLPPKVTVATLFMGGGTDVAHTWSDSVPKELIMPARIEGRFNSRADARAFAMMMLAAIPIQRTSNVSEFRLAGNPEITPDVIRLANDKDERQYWKVNIPCLAVFLTDEEYS